MIEIRLVSHQRKIKSLSLSGHANSGNKGEDLVCAAVSGIAFGLCNALDELTDEKDIVIKDNRIDITVKADDVVTQTVMMTGVIQLQTVEAENSQFVSFSKSEV